MSGTQLRTIQADFIETEGGLITLPPNYTGFLGISPSGIATVDFGAGQKNAEVIVTGIPTILSTSIITCSLRVEATASHPADDIIVDPVTVLAKNIVVGVGFTIMCTMPVGLGRGEYKVNWVIN